MLVAFPFDFHRCQDQTIAHKVCRIANTFGCFETENKFGYIHGYTDNYIKVRHPWSPSLSNKIIYAKLSKIDNEGFVRVEDFDKKNEKNKEYLYSNSYW